jgi:hypothetical protein
VWACGRDVKKNDSKFTDVVAVLLLVFLLVLFLASKSSCDFLKTAGCESEVGEWEIFVVVSASKSKTDGGIRFDIISDVVVFRNLSSTHISLEERSRVWHRKRLQCGGGWEGWVETFKSAIG